MGLTLLLEHWFNISPAVSSLVMNALCYVVGFLLLGKGFITYSFVAGVSFSLFYAIFEQFPPFWRNIADYPIAAAILGALFVGVGVGLCVRVGGAPSGDDALAMGVSRRFKVKIEWIYLLGDLLVLGMSLSYIPFKRIIYSLLTVIISGQLVGFIERFDLKNIRHKEKKQM